MVESTRCPITRTLHKLWDSNSSTPLLLEWCSWYMLGKHMKNTVLYLIQKYIAKTIGFISFMWNNMQHQNFKNKEQECKPWCGKIQNKWRLNLGRLSIFTPIPQCAQNMWFLNQFYTYLFKRIIKCPEKKPW